MHKTILILGISGGLGHACAHAFAARGWRLKALHRAPERAAAGFPDLEVDWHRGDALDRRAVRDAARGADLILHGVNPPGYRRWAELAPAMLENSLAAARAAGARLLFPANVYNYAPNPDTPLAEDAPQAPVTRKGRVRRDLEQRLARAAEGGTRVLLVRAGDFFGAPAPASWFENVMVRAGRPLTRVVYPGDFEAGHAWAYLPDLAATFAELAEREAELPPFSRFHFAGHYLPRGVTMAEAIRDAAGRPDAPIRRLPWPALRLLAPFNTTLREVLEMRYLWHTSLALDNRKLVAVLGAEPHTALPRALMDTLTALGCVPDGSEGLLG